MLGFAIVEYSQNKVCPCFELYDMLVFLVVLFMFTTAAQDHLG